MNRSKGTPNIKYVVFTAPEEDTFGVIPLPSKEESNTSKHHMSMVNSGNHTRAVTETKPNSSK